MSNVELAVFGRQGNTLSVQCTGNGSEIATRPAVQEALKGILRRDGFTLVDSSPVVITLILRPNIRPGTPLAKMAAAIESIDPGCKVQLPH